MREAAIRRGKFKVYFDPDSIRAFAIEYRIGDYEELNRAFLGMMEAREEIASDPEMTYLDHRGDLIDGKIGRCTERWCSKIGFRKVPLTNE